LVQLVYALVELLDELAFLLEICLECSLLGFRGYCRCRVFEAEEECARVLNILHTGSEVWSRRETFVGAVVTYFELIYLLH
jgi:hypothetical protein